MGLREGAGQSPIITFDGETGDRLIQPDEVMSRVVNMRSTSEGTLKSVHLPTPYIEPNSYSFTTPLRGVFHCRLRGGERDVLLVADGNKIIEASGWSGTYSTIISTTLGSPLIEDIQIDPDIVSFPAQFCATTNGVIIVPQGGSAYFYDGYHCRKFGYETKPAAPVGVGPRSTDSKYAGGEDYSGTNDGGYAVDSLDGRPSAMGAPFGRGRVGTIQTPGMVSVDTEDDAQVMGYLMSGRYRCKAQFIDMWGNLSPLSDESSDVVFERQPSTGLSDGSANWLHADAARKQIAWDGVPVGRLGTRGRILWRTRDITQTGDTKFYYLPIHSQNAINNFATLPDNVCQMYPDNIPDAWLGSEAEDFAPVPSFKLVCMAMGRVWIANFEGEEGAMMASLPALWGTFPKRKYFPDPNGYGITGIHAIDGGMLVFTDSSTYAIRPSDDGKDYKTSTVSSKIGCVAPSSIQTLDNGIVVWLGQDGFYAFDGQSASYIFEPHRFSAGFFNKGLLKTAVSAYFDGAYHCWLASHGSAVNDTCWMYDGVAWKERNDCVATGATTTRDHRKLGIICGAVGEDDGVFVVNRGFTDYSPASIETGWIGAMGSGDKKSVRTLSLWLRETGKTSKITVTAYKDFRADAVGTVLKERNQGVTGIPHFYDDGTTYEDAVWRKRKPYWTRLDFDLAAVDTFKLKISSTAGMELLGFQFDPAPRPGGSARNT